MTILDIGILILVALAGWSCYRGGFTRAGWGILSLGTGFAIASQFWPSVAAFLQKFIENPTFSKWASIIALIIVTTIIIDKIFDRMQRVVEKGVLGWVNRLLGLCFGIVSGGLLIALALILLNTYAGDGFKKEIANSRFAPQLLEIGNRVWTVSKEHVEKQLDLE